MVTVETLATPPPADGARAALPLTRDDLGRIVREAWVIYCNETGWRTAYETICPWDEMTDEHAKEVDRHIGEAVVAAAVIGLLDALAAAEARAEAAERQAAKLKQYMSGFEPFKTWLEEDAATAAVGGKGEMK